MTADPIRTHIADYSPTTSFAGLILAAPKPTDPANLAPLHADNPPSDVDPPLPNAAAALVRRKTAPLTPLPADRPIPKSP